MGLFKKKNTDYDELFTKLATENLSARELKNAEKALDELTKSGDERGILWRPLINIHRHKIKAASSDFSFAERQCGICKEYVRVRSLPVVFGLFSFWYDKYHEPISAIFTARAYEYGWGAEADHEKALEIIRETAERIQEASFAMCAPLIKKAYLEITGEEIPERSIPSPKSDESAEKDGERNNCGIPYDDSIKTVEDARRAKDNASPATASPTAAQDTADTADGFEWEEFSSVGELHEKLLRPELFRDPQDRYLLNSCLYLDTFVDEFREEFAGSDYAETQEMIAEILGAESGELTESIERRLDFIHGFTEKEYLLAAMYSLAYDERTDLAPYLANLACYLWTDTRDGDYFDPLLDLFKMSGEYDDDDSIWLCAILRMQENGNIDDPLKPNDDGSFDYQFAYFDDVFGDLLDKGYLPGSDGKMYWADSDDEDNGRDEETEDPYTGDDVLLRYKNGDSYRGAAVGGVREGFGAYLFAGGGFYRGSYHADKCDGYGMLDEGNGRVYKGLWKDDMRCGYGEQTYANGEVYRGWWKDDRFHGFGRYEFSNGAVDLGEFQNNLHEGIFLIRRNGQWFGTLWQDDEIVPEPRGPEVIDIGSDSRYTEEIVRRKSGNVITRVKHGYGEYRFSHRNGADTVDGYIGEFVNDAPCGSGMVIHTVGDFLTVLISSDFRGEAMPEGECRMISLTMEGSTQYAEYYVGGFRDSKWRGRGTLYLIGNKEICHFHYYDGLSSGSMIRCDSFDGFPTGDITVIDRDGRQTQMHLNG